MGTEKYVDYLNTLHNYRGQNENSFAERNMSNEFYKKTMVNVKVCDYIANQLLNGQPQMIILTGHAGDGKTSIMFQVLQKLNLAVDYYSPTFAVQVDGGRKCLCIKDFSELNEVERTDVLKQGVDTVHNNGFVFMVANTGPLINSFPTAFTDAERTEAEKKLIVVIDEPAKDPIDICGVLVNVINIANIDNTDFAIEYLQKITKDELWSECSNCKKHSICPITKNIALIHENNQQVSNFLRMHYTWLTEHNKRLTVRSITEQIAYMITGGLTCQKVTSKDYRYLFPNLFFGYFGLTGNDQSHKIIAVREAYNCHYDEKRLRSDEQLILREDYTSLFSNTVVEILRNQEQKFGLLPDWNKYLHRMYFFLNCIGADENQKIKDTSDIFSSQYYRYLQLTREEALPGMQDNRFMAESLAMLYTGKPKIRESVIPVTLTKSTGIEQNVQLILGDLSRNKVKLIKEKVDSSYLGNQNYILKLSLDGTTIDEPISLPLMDYFEDLKEGVISTIIDPQLTHGIEAIKAQISQIVDDHDSDEISLNVIGRNDITRVTFAFDNNRIEIG